VGAGERGQAQTASTDERTQRLLSRVVRRTLRRLPCVCGPLVRRDAKNRFHCNVLEGNQASPPVADYKVLDGEYKSLLKRAKTLIIARHKTVAHIDQFLTEKEVFAKADPTTYNETRDLIYDAATFVAKLAGHESQPGIIGIGRDRRLLEATLSLIRALA
jgi:hypothetical protein